jgi:hypothetical protein
VWLFWLTASFRDTHVYAQRICCTDLTLERAEDERRDFISLEEKKGEEPVLASL